MIKKIIVALVVIVAVVGIVFATIGNSDNKNTNNNSNITVEQQKLPTNDNTTNNTSEKLISSAKAQKIATNFIEEASATAGTPTLTKQDNKMVYIVPIIENGINVGEITIDAETGENLGGAGGSP
jgi:uncharacterized membrane protein YkoI